jgi:hypothetical protein
VPTQHTNITFACGKMQRHFAVDALPCVFRISPFSVQGYLAIADAQEPLAAARDALRTQLSVSASTCPAPCGCALPTAAMALAAAALSVGSRALERCTLLTAVWPRSSAPPADAETVNMAECDAESAAGLLRCAQATQSKLAERTAACMAASVAASVGVPGATAPAACAAALAADCSEWLQVCTALEVQLALLVIWQRQRGRDKGKLVLGKGTAILRSYAEGSMLGDSTNGAAAAVDLKGGHIAVVEALSSERLANTLSALQCALLRSLLQLLCLLCWLCWRQETAQIQMVAGGGSYVHHENQHRCLEVSKAVP